jgi:predicted nucleic acid-binding protein
MKYLLDTNVISETVKAKPDKAVAYFLRETPVDALYISVLTIGEITKGVEKLDYNMARKQVLSIWLENDLLSFFSGRIIPINKDIAHKWGIICAALKNATPVIDSLLAATALCNNLTLVTRNTKDFKNFPIEVLNPWLTDK